MMKQLLVSFKASAFCVGLILFSSNLLAGPFSWPERITVVDYSFTKPGAVLWEMPINYSAVANLNENGQTPVSTKGPANGYEATFGLVSGLYSKLGNEFGDIPIGDGLRLAFIGTVTFSETWTPSEGPHGECSYSITIRKNGPGEAETVSGGGQGPGLSGSVVPGIGDNDSYKRSYFMLAATLKNEFCRYTRQSDGAQFYEIDGSRANITINGALRLIKVKDTLSDNAEVTLPDLQVMMGGRDGRNAIYGYFYRHFLINEATTIVSSKRVCNVEIDRTTVDFGDIAAHAREGKVTNGAPTIVKLKCNSTIDDGDVKVYLSLTTPNTVSGDSNAIGLLDSTGQVMDDLVVKASRYAAGGCDDSHILSLTQKNLFDELKAGESDKYWRSYFVYWKLCKKTSLPLQKRGNFTGSAVLTLFME